MNMEAQKVVQIINKKSKASDSDELSDEAYEMKNRSAQECNSDELDGGLAYSDEEDDGFRSALNK